MATICKRGDSWHAQVRKKRHKPITQSFTARRDAEIWARKVESELERGIFQDLTIAQQTTLSEILDRYASEVIPHKRAQRTEYSSIRLFRQEIGHLFLAKVSSHHIATIRDKRLKQGINPQSKGVNQLSNIQYITHIGMIHRNPKTHIAGQKRDLEYQVDDKQRHDTQLSEHVDQFYQGLNRYVCRKTANGKASPVTAWLWYPSDDILEPLRKLMSGVNIVEYQPQYLKTNEYSPNINANKIVEIINKGSKDKYSWREIRNKTGITIDPRTKAWSKTKETALMLLSDLDWNEQGQSTIKS